jgi:hypothetical protein
MQPPSCTLVHGFYVGWMRVTLVWNYSLSPNPMAQIACEVGVGAQINKATYLAILKFRKSDYLDPTNRENRLLVTDELVKVENELVILAEF